MIKPHITEKALDQAKQGKYTFIIDGKLNKIQIAKLVNKIFDVTVIQVSVFNRKGKSKKFAQKIGLRKDKKIAIVTLDKKQKIKEFEIVNEETNKKDNNK